MIKINFSPVRADSRTVVQVSGSTIIVNNESYDLSDIPDGATVNHPAVRNCTRNGDDYELTLVLTHGANAPSETRFPDPIEVTEANFELEYTHDLA